MPTSNYVNRRKVLFVPIAADNPNDIRVGEKILRSSSVMCVKIEAENDLSDADILISLHPSL